LFLKGRWSLVLLVVCLVCLAAAAAGLNGVFTEICASDSRGATLSAADMVSASRMRSALTGLSAAKAMIEAYTRLAFPRAMASETSVRAALLGEGAILDRSRLCSVVASGESGLSRMWLEEVPGRRLDLLRADMRDLLQSSSASGASTLVDGVLERLDSAIRVQRLRARVASAR
jgi:hypothetical protein